MSRQKLPLCGMSNGMVVINSQPIAFHLPLNTPVEGELFNLTPRILIGQKNRIEPWAKSTLDDSNHEALMVINNIEIGCESK